MTRRGYVDWARGIAVLLMIEAHTFDAWTRVADRDSNGYRNAVLLGGFAAPLFLWLAGLAVVWSVSRTAERTGSRRIAIAAGCQRGMEIFILAFLFRLQAFLVSPGQSLVTLFRVDVLNVMGPSMVAAALVWSLWPPRGHAAPRIIAFAVLTTAIAMVTPIVRASPILDRLPTWIAWYLRPSGEHTTFTLFPWSGFVFAGAAVGAVLSARDNPRLERTLHAALGVVGAAIVALGFYAASLPTIYRASWFWTSSPAWFAIRVGILMIALAVLFAIEYVTRARIEPLAKFGRASLFIYWIHVELVYGYATWAMRRQLPIWMTAFAFVGFCYVMYRAIPLRDRAIAWWRRRTAAEAPAMA